MDQSLTAVRTRRELLALGLTDAEIKQRVNAGAMLKLRHGVYGKSSIDHSSRSEAVRQIHATIATLRAPAVVCGPSAARLWGGRTWKLDARIHIARSICSGIEPGSRIVQHRTAIPDADRAMLSGLECTSLERTALDLLRFAPPPSALVFLDWSLRNGAAERNLALRVAGLGSTRGARRAMETFALRDSRSESFGETLVRFHLAVARLEGFVPQLEIVTESGVKRLDLGHPGLKVAVEFDGLGKYRGEFGIDPADAVRAERSREASLRSLGWRIERFMTSDLSEPAAIVHRVRAAMHQVQR